MVLDFPIPVESLGFSLNEFEPLQSPLFANPYLQIDENNLILKVHNVASYQVKQGNYIRIFPCKDADESSVNLFLNGSVLGAILHQRKTIPFHGSSFTYKGKGILICGHSGAGKSSIVAAFCQNGATFINDDITPVQIEKNQGTILPIKTHIKLWSDSLDRLNIKNKDFKQIRPSFDKFYLPVESPLQEHLNLHHFILLQIHENDEFKSEELSGLPKFNALRRMIYRKIYLKGMPETEKNYFRQLVQLSEKVRVTRVFRPRICEIQDAMSYIQKEIIQ